MNNKENLDKSLRLIAKSSLIIFIGLILSKVFTFLYRVLIGREYGPEGYGLFSLSLMIISWLIVFASLGLSDGILRYIPLYRGKKQINKIKFLFQSSLKFLFILGILATIILFVAADFLAIHIFHNPNLIIFIKIFSFAIPLTMLLDFFMSLFVAFEKVNQQSLMYNILNNALKPALLIFFILFGLRDGSVPLSFIIGTFITLLVAYLYCFYKIPEVFGKHNLRKNEQLKIIKEVFSYSWPIIFIGIFGGLFYSIDSFILGYYKSVTEVGFYNAAVTIATLLTITPLLFLKLFFSLIMKAYSKKNNSLIRDLSKQVSKWIFIINLPAFILMFLFPGTIINLLFGKEYLVAETSLRFLLLGNLAVSFYMVSVNLVSMVGKSKIILKNIILAGILNLILDLVLIPMPKIFWLDNSNGVTGSSIASFVYMVFLGFLFIIQAKKYTSITPFKNKMIRVIFVTFIPLIILIFLKSQFESNLFTTITLGLSFLLIYSLIILLTGCLDKNDLMILTSIKNKIPLWNRFFHKENVI